MPDTRERLSHITISLHWLIAIAIIAMIPFGMYVEDLPRAERAGPVSIHAAIGFMIFAVAILRTAWRASQGFPPHAGNYARWEISLARIVHWALLIATVTLPVSGMMMVLGGSGEIDLFGAATIGPFTSQRIRAIESVGQVVHEIGANLLMVAIALHVAGALKHHVTDRDATLRRMLGARQAPRQ